MKVKIVGTGSAVPEKCVTNDDLSQWMDTSDEWIRSRTGIETRHLAVRETTTEMAVEAAKRALASAHMDAEELDLIIAATILVCGLGFSSGLTFQIAGTSITLTGLAIAAIMGVFLNAVLPGREEER